MPSLSEAGDIALEGWVFPKVDNIHLCTNHFEIEAHADVPLDLIFHMGAS